VLDLQEALQTHGVASAAFAVLKEGSALRV